MVLLGTTLLLAKGTAARRRPDVVVLSVGPRQADITRPVPQKEYYRMLSRATDYQTSETGNIGPHRPLFYVELRQTGNGWMCCDGFSGASVHMGSMSLPFKSEPFFIVRFWVPRGDSSRDGHVTLAQQDGTYIGGYWDTGVFHWSESLQADITRTGYSPTLTLKLFYKDHLPDFGAIKVWLKNALLSQTSDPDVTCSSLIYHVLVKGGATCGDMDPTRVTPAVLREIIFDMIRQQTKDY